jgi:folate-dependent phosphoribosylglycinamide formyltransferase PurN
MNIVLMVSRVTYAPNNYRELVEGYLDVSGCRVAGVLVFDNRNKTVLMQGVKLIAAGAVRLGTAVIANWIKNDPKMEIANRHRIPIYKTSNPHSASCLKWLRDLQPDLLLHLRTRCILKSELLQIPRLGAVNVHHGLLPETRGTMCDLRILAQGRRSGFSLHQMTAAVDCGDVFCRVEVADAAACGKNYWTYLKQSANCEVKAVRTFLEQAAVGTYRDTPSQPPPNVPSILYKTPTMAEFKAWRREGWKL